MGYRLRREVSEYAPSDVPHQALWLWAEIADDANDTTRVSMIRRDTLLRRARMGRTQLLRWLRYLAERGYELRIVRGKDKHGNPVFAYEGTRITYFMPMLRPEGVDIADTLSDAEGVGIAEPSDPKRVSGSQPEGVGISHQRVSGSRAPFPSVPSSPLSSDAITEDDIHSWLRTNKASTNPKALLRTSDGPRLRAEALAAIQRERVDRRETAIHNDPAGWRCYWCNTANRAADTHCRNRACGESRAA